jgi:hypothetical protein
MVLLRTYNFKIFHDLARPLSVEYDARNGKKAAGKPDYLNPLNPMHDYSEQISMSPDGRKVCFIKKRGDEVTPERDKIVLFDLEKGEARYLSTAASRYSAFDILISCEWKNRDDQLTFIAAGSADSLLDEHTYFTYSLPDNRISVQVKLSDMYIITIYSRNYKTPSLPDFVPLKDKTWKLVFEGKGTYHFMYPNKLFTDFSYWRFSEEGKFMILSVGSWGSIEDINDPFYERLRNTNALMERYFLFGFKSAKVYHVADVYSQNNIVFMAYNEKSKVFLVTFNNSCDWFKKHGNNKDCHDYEFYMIKADDFTE